MFEEILKEVLNQSKTAHQRFKDAVKQNVDLLRNISQQEIDEKFDLFGKESYRIMIFSKLTDLHGEKPLDEALFKALLGVLKRINNTVINSARKLMQENKVAYKNRQQKIQQEIGMKASETDEECLKLDKKANSFEVISSTLSSNMETVEATLKEYNDSKANSVSSLDDKREEKIKAFQKKLSLVLDANAHDIEADLQTYLKDVQGWIQGENKIPRADTKGFKDLRLKAEQILPRIREFPYIKAIETELRKVFRHILSVSSQESWEQIEASAVIAINKNLEAANKKFSEITRDYNDIKHDVLLISKDASKDKLTFGRERSSALWQSASSTASNSGATTPDLSTSSTPSSPRSRSSSS